MSAAESKQIAPGALNNSSEPDLSSETKLTSKELNHLCQVMLRAKKFDEEESKTVEGQLSKYTNVVKGWQYRWFVINAGQGVLDYYTLEDRKKPRGRINLAGCQIVPSDEDSQTFAVNAAYGEVYKLKALDAKERQIWVDNLRQAVQMQERKAIQKSQSLSAGGSSSGSINKGITGPSITNSPLTTDILHSFDSVQNQLAVTRENYDTIVNMVEDITNTDEDLLIFKATSQAAVNSLEQCFSILEYLSINK